MPDPIEDRRSPLSPQLAVRVAIVGSVVLALFAVIFFRLWFLQVLSGTQYVAQAKVNQVRDIQVLAQRGDILDSNGQILVDSVRALTVQITPTQMPVQVTLTNIGAPPRADAAVFNRLAHVLGLSTKRAGCKIAGPPYHARLSPIACLVAQQVSLQPYGDVTVKTKVASNVYYYVAERQSQFRGVSVAQNWITNYPDGTLAAQVLGTVGRITTDELKARTYPGASKNSVVGQSGLEAQYDNFLRGTDGMEKVQVNSDGEPTGTIRPGDPIAGHNLQTSLNARLQNVGQQSLANSVSQAGDAGGAFVAMNPDNGEIYAMGSNPSYDANLMVDPTTKIYDQLTSTNANDPLLNRAIESVGPTGSTFKPITATAALESGAWSVDKIFDDNGNYCVGTGAARQCQRNSGGGTYGPVELVTAIKCSVDTFFYNLGAILNPADPLTHPNGGPLQTWARNFGIGRNPHIDLPGAKSGTLPDQRWREQRNRAEYECDTATGPFRYTDGRGAISARFHRGWRRAAKHAPGGCGIADGTDRPWSIGDDIHLAVGQGDVQVSPLQLAVAYSALANGGTIVSPHLGLNVEDADGTVLQKVGPDPPQRHLSINPIYLDAIRQGLREAASSPGGTSADVMGKFPQQVYGKTGTAQYFNAEGVETDYGWYSCFVPASATSKPIEVTVWVEKGGFGDIAAAPVARQILSQWFYDKPGPYKPGTSSTL